MNLLLFFFSVSMNCVRYEITHNNYKSIKKLITKPHESGLYSEIINNLNFLCSFEVNENQYGNNKEIKIIRLHNHDTGTCNNIFPVIFCEISDTKRLILIRLKLSRLPNQFRKFKELE
ncbi:hypothetical protein SLOPH_2503, partial [Spraguea lophii 42_110]